ncbi:1950_t:CDS:10 [Paraglomus occultum]|uniref:1950_t:CDS:1 n=1 Tax=Paraglomus occultum TaxID=144539 RepID=A0A9N8WNH8_9GLOM|nr:1950_t:CDS:10 [Paraglomus occultum]
MSFEFNDAAVRSYFKETSPNLWSYSDFLEKVVKPISHTLYDRDPIKANRGAASTAPFRPVLMEWRVVPQQPHFFTHESLPHPSSRVVPLLGHGVSFPRADNYNNDQGAYFWKEMFENNKLQEERVALKRKADGTALELASTSLDYEKKKDDGEYLQQTVLGYSGAITPPSQIECNHSYQRQRRPGQVHGNRFKPFDPFGSDKEDDSEDVSAEIDREDDSEDSEDDLIDEHIIHPKTTSFDEYVKVHKESGWTLEDGRQVIDVITQNTTKLAESVSKKSKKERSPIIMSVIRLGFSSIVDLSLEYQERMYSWFGDEWSSLKEKVYNTVNMIPNSFDGEIKPIIDTVEKMCDSYQYVDARAYLFKMRSEKSPPMVQQIATIYFRVIDKFLDNPHIFVEETGKQTDLSEMEYAINMTAPILNDIFNDVLDILKLRWGVTLSTANTERRRKIDLRIVHRYKDIELSHSECAKAPTPVKAIRDRSKCLRTAKTVLDRFLEEDLSDDAVKDSTILAIQFAGLHGQIIGIDLLDDGGLEGSRFSFPAQLSNIKCL